MKTQLLLCTILFFALNASPAGAQDRAAPLVDRSPEHELIFAPGDIDWQPGPASFAPGAEFAILEGNPSETGVFTMRIRMPDGFIIAPHWHPGVERVTVISGVFHLGHGETLDSAATQRLPTGSYFSLPAEMRHFAIAEGETIIQLSSVGPWELTYVDSADDPRRTE
jgi:quercetin dioxygenase-like cupin family protein